MLSLHVNFKELRRNYIILLICCALLAGCSSTKFIPDNQYLLDKVEIKSDTKGFDAATLAPYIRQKANSKWFNFFKIPLGAYSLAGRDSTKWINRTLKKMGEEPVVYDTLQAQLTCNDLETAMHNMGYMHATATLETKVKGKKLTAIYTLHPHEPYYIHSFRTVIEDDTIAALLKPYARSLAGHRFTVDELEGERVRIAKILSDEGYYKFHKDFIQFEADSASNSKDINVTMRVMNYITANKEIHEHHPRYKIAEVNFVSNDSDRIHLRQSVLEQTAAIKPGQYYSNSNLQRTYNNFARLGAVRYTNISFRERPDTTLLDCDIQISTNKPNTVSFQPEGTNTAGDLGAALSITWQNRNLFRGSELLSVQVRGAFEAITGLEGYQNQDYEEYSIESKLTFPRFVAPFLSQEFRRRSTATSELSLSWNLQNRPEFHRRVFSTAWRYRWDNARRNLAYRLDVLDLNYVHMPWISETFRRDYLDNAESRNAILRYNYEDLFIMKTGFGFTYSDGSNVVRANVETAGNLLEGLSGVFNFKKNENGQHEFINIAYAEYAKFDVDYTHLFTIDRNNSIACHVAFGIAYPYGNSNILPFEKRYFSGGANSVRGWSVRELGPGKFKGTDGRIDFINQTGDMKLDMNVEYRSHLFWKFNSAVFIDAGNIWTLRNYEDQPGGQFKFNSFYKQIAVAYGVGLRLNFGYFILRFDMGMKAINPAYETNEEHYAIFHPDFSRDFTFHFAVGLPF
ncbi:MAG: BamA/TamA family outer membrane protein [Prevotella sp.]|jgi:outer membrane protein assembly factor BamA